MLRLGVVSVKVFSTVFACMHMVCAACSMDTCRVSVIDEEMEQANVGRGDEILPGRD